jgi:hypothetical protein
MDRQTVGSFFNELEKIAESADYVDDLEAPPVGSVMQYLRAAHGMGKRSSWEDIGPDPSPNVAWIPPGKSKRASISFRQDVPSGEQPLTSDQLRGIIRNATKSPKFRAHMSGLAEEIRSRKQKKWEEKGPIKRTLTRLGIGTPPPKEKLSVAIPAIQHTFITGMPGSGKTTAAHRLERRTGIPVLHGDDLPPDKSGRPGTSALKLALKSLKTPHIIEGVQVMGLRPKDVSGHKVQIIEPSRQIIVGRLVRRGWKPEDDNKVQYDKHRAGALYDEMTGNLAAFKNRIKA